MSPTNDTCANDDCDEPTPWDMAAVVFSGAYHCSPACAREVLDKGDRAPEPITLHDPQYAVDRDEFSPAVGADAVDITRDVGGSLDAHIALDGIVELFPGEFRVSNTETDGE